MIPESLKTIKRKIANTNGLPSDNNHDPSNVLKVGDTYYLWYTQHVNHLPYDAYANCKIMCCTSKDGCHWEKGFDALLPGTEGQWDETGVLTANVIPHEGRYYMFYTGVNRHYDDPGYKRCCGLAVSDHPSLMFEKFMEQPVFSPGKEGSWDDSCCDDISAVYWNGQWRIYYKGHTAGTSADDTMLGVAFSDKLTGPYCRYEGNPLLRGHAFAIWPYRNGLLLLSGLKHDHIGKIYGGDWHDPAGKQYLYYSEDGLHFEPCCEFANRAAGIYSPGSEADLTECFGIIVNTKNKHLERFLERVDFAREK